MTYRPSPATDILFSNSTQSDIRDIPCIGNTVVFGLCLVLVCISCIYDIFTICVIIYSLFILIATQLHMGRA